MTDGDLAPQEPVLRLDDEVRRTIVELRADEPNADSLALWVEVSGSSGDTYTYDVWFQALSDAAKVDAVVRHDDLSVVIPAASVDRMLGSTLELDADGGMIIKNPNRPPVDTGPSTPGMGMAPADLTGDVAQRVIQVLDQQIN